MTTFGEIVEPITRTAWEDWDEIILERDVKEFKWKQDLESPEEIEVFVLCEGKYLADCIKMQGKHKLELINSISEVKLNLFRSKTSNKYVCTIRDYNLVLSSEIVELLRQYLIVSNDVIAIQTKALPEYQTLQTSDQDCIIRTISTTKAPTTKINVDFPKLEQPNIISGVSAGVISLREHLNQPGTAVVCYMEHPEEYQIEAVEKLLEKLNISQNSSSRPSSILNSNLYI